ncbi:MAG: 3-(cis-5,6-dihydroxycyclohexa-1,3-dien-1-yl)propanoate dehydrogenase [Pseudomonadales bacterium]|nr:3-(cis-5,6-dihydroxycyclohexa-1,3-dien-1-yl)propanoate dehydrogenase [Pseudomonadales bacterium]
MSSLKGEVALVTGAGSGLGRAIVDRFIEEGAQVLAFDQSEEKLAALNSCYGAELSSYCGDVRSLQDNKRAVALCLEKYAKLDCAIGNAGIWDYSTSLDALPEERIDLSFDELFHINVKGYMLLAKAALPALVRSEGSLVFTVSNAGFYPNGGGPLYTAAKHAVVGLIRQLAFEFAPYVKVNGVAPGPIDSDLRGPAALGMSETSISSLNLPKIVPSSIPTAKVPTPAEYAGAYVWYASRRDNIASTGGVHMSDTGIGIRGIGTVSGGSELGAKYKL